MKLLLEIGLEEIPAAYLVRGMEELERKAMVAFQEARLGKVTLRTFGAPRRLAFLAQGLAQRQEDLVVLAKGPSVAVGLVNWAGGSLEIPPVGLPLGDGYLLTKAAEGFARGQGLPGSDLLIMDTPAGPYLFARKKIAGEGATKVLPDLLARLVGRLEFPKSMQWGEGGHRFIRPIRWLLALLDTQPLTFEATGVTAGGESRGHRFLHPGMVPVVGAGAYVDVLRESWVLADREERRARIEEGVKKTAAEAGGQARLIPDLLEEVTDLVEYPTAFAGSFPEEYLALPDEVLVTTMRSHQRYFPVEKDGKLLPTFVAVRNGGDRGLDTVRIGNEKVLKARLADAAFFYREDRKKPLGDRVEALRGIMFQEVLGSMYEKTQRVLRLSRRIDPLGSDKLDRVALLSKADLLTNMVREFPELQGIMGRAYALAGGEDGGVAEGIFQHLLPRNPEDALPKGLGATVALADKLDTVAGGFLAGLRTTGSEDPYGLRRQGAGIVRILADLPLSLSLEDLGRDAFAEYGDGSYPVGEAEAGERLRDFFQGRVRGYLRDAGYGPEIVEATVGAGWAIPVDVKLRAAAIAAMWEKGELAAVLVPWRRAASLAGEGGMEVDYTLLGEEVEGALAMAVRAVEQEAAELLAQADYPEYCRRLRTLGPVLARFFLEVMVMVEDAALRENRLAMLRRVSALFAPVAKWSALFPLVEVEGAVE